MIRHPVKGGVVVVDGLYSPLLLQTYLLFSNDGLANYSLYMAFMMTKTKKQHKKKRNTFIYGRVSYKSAI